MKWLRRKLVSKHILWQKTQNIGDNTQERGYLIWQRRVLGVTGARATVRYGGPAKSLKNLIVVPECVATSEPTVPTVPIRPLHLEEGDISKIHLSLYIFHPYVDYISK